MLHTRINAFKSHKHLSASETMSFELRSNRLKKLNKKQMRKDGHALLLVIYLFFCIYTFCTEQVSKTRLAQLNWNAITKK